TDRVLSELPPAVVHVVVSWAASSTTNPEPSPGVPAESTSSSAEQTTTCTTAGGNSESTRSVVDPSRLWDAATVHGMAIARSAPAAPRLAAAFPALPNSSAGWATLASAGRRGRSRLADVALR